jgi:D-alanine-D-alanine ligase
MPTSDGWQNVDRLIEQTRALRNQIAILVVANVKSGTDLHSHSLETEYFSQDELEQIIEGFRDFGFYVQAFFSEDRFIQAVLAGELELIHQKYKIVYNSAQSGTGPGRKSLIPSFCQLHDINTTSSDAYVVSLARHKYHVNCIMRAVNLPAPPSWLFHWKKGWNLRQRPENTVRPLILKPIYESASIGIDENSIVGTDSDLDGAAQRLSMEFNQPIVVQRFVAGREVEVPVIGLDTPFAPQPVGLSLAEEEVLDGRILTYDIVSSDRYGFYDLKKEEVSPSLAQLSIEAFETLGIRGFGRIDFRIDAAGNCFIIDVATNPHIIKHSSFHFLFMNTGRDYPSLLGLLVALACERLGWN